MACMPASSKLVASALPLSVPSPHQKSVWCVCFYGKRLLLSGSSDHSIKVRCEV